MLFHHWADTDQGRQSLLAYRTWFCDITSKYFAAITCSALYSQWCESSVFCISWTGSLEKPTTVDPDVASPGIEPEWHSVSPKNCLGGPYQHGCPELPFLLNLYTATERAGFNCGPRASFSEKTPRVTFFVLKAFAISFRTVAVCKVPQHVFVVQS